MDTKRIIRKFKSFLPVMRGIANVSFSQFGEDIIMLRMLERYGVVNITYLDIGANDPVHGSNTYAFYLRGFTGVLIEPNISLYNKLKNIRPMDKSLNFGISSGNHTDADYYMFSEENNGMNTFSKEEAINYEKEGFRIKKTIKLPLRDINDVLAENFNEAPTIISLDVEGLDEIILQKIDFEKYQPLLICVETVSYNKNGELTKRKGILDLLISKGYFIYADTHVNTIFCSRKKFDRLVK
jgi:FkbM family methyltransferase